MNKKFDPSLPLYIEIPTPMPEPELRGKAKQSLKAGRRDRWVRMRASFAEVRTIDQAVEITGCANVSEFLRWIILHSARKIIREKERNDSKRD